MIINNAVRVIVNNVPAFKKNSMILFKKPGIIVNSCGNIINVPRRTGKNLNIIVNGLHPFFQLLLIINPFRFSKSLTVNEAQGRWRKFLKHQ
jgi:hypothetical protein